MKNGYFERKIDNIEIYPLYAVSNVVAH